MLYPWGRAGLLAGLEEWPHLLEAVPQAVTTGKIVPTECLSQKTQVATVSAFKGVGSEVRDRQRTAGLRVPLIPGLAIELTDGFLKP